MVKESVILLVEDDDGHARLIKNNIKRAGIQNEIILFNNGEETLNFLNKKGTGHHRKKSVSYFMLLDLHLPSVSGFDVLKQIKQNSELQHIPVIVISMTDDPDKIDLCYKTGCLKYIIKPVNYKSFSNTIRQLGLYIHRKMRTGMGSPAIN